MNGARRLVPLALLILLGIAFYPGFAFHWRAAQDAYVNGDDARQYLPVFDKHLSDIPVPETYIKRYYEHAAMLPGYKAIYILAAKFWDTHALARVLCYALYLLTVLLLAGLAWRVGGIWPAAGTLSLLLSSDFLLQWGFVGGTSRMFGYLGVAACLWLLHAGRPYALAALTVIMMLFYPVVAALCGVSLALWLAFLSPSMPWRRRFLLLATACMACVAALAPLMLGGREYGARVSAGDVAAWPEAGREGRYAVIGDALPYPLLDAGQMVYYLADALRGFGAPLAPALSLREHAPAVIAAGLLALCAVIAGWWALVRRNPACAPLLMPFVAGMLLHVLAYIGQPYLYIPGRYLLYTLPLVSVFLLPLALYGLSLTPPRRYAPAMMAGPVLMLLLLFGGRGDAYTPWQVVIPQQDQAFYEQVAQLPADALIAGWPAGQSMHDINLDNVAFLSRRNALLTHEVHQVLHMGYMQEMRKRMDSIVAAYTAGDAAPLLALREKYGVTHFLVNLAHYREKPPAYFAPWDDIGGLSAQAFLADPARYKNAIVLRHDDVLLLDLARLTR